MVTKSVGIKRNSLEISAFGHNNHLSLHVYNSLLCVNIELAINFVKAGLLRLMLLCGNSELSELQ